VMVITTIKIAAETVVGAMEAIVIAVDMIRVHITEDRDNWPVRLENRGQRTGQRHARNLALTLGDNL